MANSNANNGYLVLNDDPHNNSPADIIAYIGIPLAVLGVLPIFYVCVNTVVTAYNVRRRLKQNAIKHYVTRSSILTGIIEIEFPVHSLAPLERAEPGYWGMNANASSLKGGSWSLFNWNKLVVGKRQYRIQYSADIREPQADIDFDELINFLIDRGAVPDPKGFRLLNMAGLWTPANTSLLLSSDRSESVLRVTFPEESDGILSLALQWRPEWGSADAIGPHWIEVVDQMPLQATLGNEKLLTSEGNGQGEKTVVHETSKPVSEPNSNEADAEAASIPRGRKLHVHLGMKNASPVIDEIRVLPRNPKHALNEEKDGSATTPAQHHLSSHLQDRSISSWVAVFCTAWGSSTGASIYLVKPSPQLSELSKRDVLPCGVLVLASILNDDEVPSWATQYNPSEESQSFVTRIRASNAARSAEERLPPAQRDAARQLREAKERDDRFAEVIQKMHRTREREQLKEREAIESSLMKTEVAANGVLRRLPAFDGGKKTATNEAESQITGPWETLAKARQTVLYLMVSDGVVAKEVCSVLDRWTAWEIRGGMNRDDLEAVLKDGGKWFCYAIVLMALLKEESSKESTLAVDLQECITTWKRVRLG